MSRHTHHWWTSSAGHARLTAVGAGVLITLLGIVSAVVWASPNGRNADVATSGLTVQTPQQTDAEILNAELAKQISTLQAQLARTEFVSDTQRLQSQAKIDELIARVAASEKAAADAGAQARDAKARAAKSTAPGKTITKTTSTGTVVTAPAKSTLVNPGSRYLGLYTTQSPFNWAAVDDVSTKLGTLPGISGYFQGWDQTFRADAVERSWSRGMLPLLTWESRPIAAGNDQPEDPNFSIPRIIGDPAAGVPGAYDAYLHDYAKQIAATGLPLAIRFDHEMNGNWYPWSENKSDGSALNGNRQGDYVKLWQYVHDIFQQEGANDYVIWLWAPNVVNNLASQYQNQAYLASFYPGDDYVDWVGLSGYQRSATATGSRATAGYTFNTTLDQLRGITDKPIILAEVGATENGGLKASWITSLFAMFADPANADLIGLVWFNNTVTTISGGARVTNDWRIESRGDSLTAFRSGVERPDALFALRPFPN